MTTAEKLKLNVLTEVSLISLCENCISSTLGDYEIVLYLKFFFIDFSFIELRIYEDGSFIQQVGRQ